jgi:NAD(P)-dependent dehydrogenase (short-subunit alcohol dehydrogenase family)
VTSTGRPTGETALVTGGSGLGKASALRFAEEGAAVAVADLDLGAATTVSEEITAAGGRALPVTANVTSDADSRRMIEETLAAFSQLGIVFANVGCEGCRERRRHHGSRMRPKTSGSATPASSLGPTYADATDAADTLSAAIPASSPLNGEHRWSGRLSDSLMVAWHPPPNARHWASDSACSRMSRRSDG